MANDVGAAERGVDDSFVDHAGDAPALATDRQHVPLAEPVLFAELPAYPHLLAPALRAVESRSAMRTEVAGLAGADAALDTIGEAEALDRLRQDDHPAAQLVELAACR